MAIRNVCRGRGILAMNGFEFFMSSVGLACVLGPIIGLLAAIGVALVRRAAKRPFRVTIGREKQP